MDASPTELDGSEMPRSLADPALRARKGPAGLRMGRAGDFAIGCAPRCRRSPATPRLLPRALPTARSRCGRRRRSGRCRRSGCSRCCSGCSPGAVSWLGPDLVRDWRIDGEVVEAQGARIEEHALPQPAGAGQRVRRDLRRREGASEQRQDALVLLHRPGRATEPIVLVRPKGCSAATRARSPPTWGSTSSTTGCWRCALIVGMLVFCIALSIQLLRQGVVTRRALAGLSGQALHPVIVGLEGSITIAHKRRRWTYVYDEGGRQERAFIELASGQRSAVRDARRQAGAGARRARRRRAAAARQGAVGALDLTGGGEGGVLRRLPQGARQRDRSGRGAAAVAHSAR